MIKVKDYTNIKILLSDVDGVLTDGKLHYTNDDEHMKSFNVKDGMIVKYLLRSGITVGIITGRSSQILETRAKELNIDMVYQGVADKIEVLEIISKTHNINYNEMAFIGDDINDLEVIKTVGLSAAPRDAVDLVQNAVDYTCKLKGGQGAFREFADLILSKQ